MTEFEITRREVLVTALGAAAATVLPRSAVRGSRVVGCAVMTTQVPPLPRRDPPPPPAPEPDPDPTRDDPLPDPVPPSPPPPKQPNL